MSKTFKHAPMGRFDWERIIARAELPAITKSVAMFIAMRANQDGSNAHPGVRWLADVLDRTERYIIEQITLLRDLALIERTDFGRTGESFDTYQLTVPGPADIPLRMRLNPNGHRYIPRPEPKPRPRKRKDGPDGTGSPLQEDGPDRDPATRSPLQEEARGNGTATRTPLPVDGPAASVATGSQLPEDGAPTGTRLHVDNSDSQNSASGSSTPHEDQGSSPTGNPLPSYRKPAADLGEAGFTQGDPYQPLTNTGSPKATDSPAKSIKPVDEDEADDRSTRTADGHALTPTLGVDVLDGDGHTAVQPMQAYAELKEAVRLLDGSGERDRWVTEAHAALAAKGPAPKPNVVTIAAAELYRRSVHHPNDKIMNGGS